MFRRSLGHLGIYVLLVFIVLCCQVAGARPAAAYAPPVPSQLKLTVRETAGVARSGEVVRSGVPLPRSLNLRSVAGLTLVDGGGSRVPAEFEATARWNAALSDGTAPIQWLLVTFPATVPAHGTATYRVVTDGSAGTNPAPARPLSVTQSGNAVTVDTGAAIFRLGADATALFDEVVLDNGTRLATGGNGLTLQTNGATAGHSTTRRVWIEHAGPLAAAVVVEGQYDTPALGGAGIGSRRRYTFTAGSGTALVRQSAAWEGTLNTGCPSCVITNGVINGVKVERVRDRLAPELGGTPTVTAVGSFASSATVKSVAAGQSAWVRQKLRGSRTTSLSFDVNVAGTTASGVKADGGVLAASGPRGTLAIALSHMHRYEPQALRLLADGGLAVDLADDRAWLAHHQGLYANFAVAGLPGTAGRATLDAAVWAPLNHPLHAWPEAAWFAASDAVLEFPAASVATDLSTYDSTVSAILSRTLSQVDALGIAGLQTYGVFPRYWGKPNVPGEVDCGSTNDPTPTESWDNTYWCATWTDYHMAAESAVVRAMRAGEVDWLDEIAIPAAQRMLHTQIMQCSPTDLWFYCGQAPSGYGAYRTDFNSSHAYWENLFLYYWLTGDRTVIDVIQRGGDHMRRFMCSQRGPQSNPQASLPSGPACAADDPVRTPMLGRVAGQWFAAFRFLGLASNDGSFLDDYRSGLARMVTNYYVEALKNGVAYGFLSFNSLLGTTVTTATTDQIWMSSFYDMENLYRFSRDSGDAAIGIPAVAPSRVIAAFARTLRDIEPRLTGDGTINGSWPLKIDLAWSGSRVGGTLLSTAASTDPAERALYAPEKAAATALLVRAGQQAGDASLIDWGRQLSDMIVVSAAGEQAPLGKLEGQDLTRLHAAVARLSDSSTGSPTPQPPSGAPAAPSGLTATQLPNNVVALAWQDNSSDETGFHIEMLTNGVFQEIRVVGANVTSYNLSGYAAGVQHTFRVRAGNGAGFSAYSNTASTISTGTTSSTGSTGGISLVDPPL
jgi:fibronectin type III domain protein